MMAAQLVEDGEAVAVEVAPVEKRHVGKPRHACQLTDGESSAVDGDDSRKRGKCEHIHHIFADENAIGQARPPAQLLNR